MACWNKDKTFKLWNEDNIQAQLEGCKWNQEVYTKISRVSYLQQATVTPMSNAERN